MSHRHSLAVAPHHPVSPSQRPVALPIHQTTTFVMDRELERRMEEGDYRSAYLYTRMSNPTLDALAERLARLHGAEDCVLTSSGMGALTSALIALVPPGGMLIADEQLYGVTLSFLDRYFIGMGRRVEVRDLRRDSALDVLDGTEQAWVLAEIISNPMLAVTPVRALAARVRAKGGRLMIDNTFANPITCRPLELGADLVIESLSKSISGHSDAHGGAILGAKGLVEPCWQSMIHLGPCLDPHAAWLIDRGVRTLPLRTEAASANALCLAERLRDHPDVEAVLYPGLASHPEHTVTEEQCANGGSMVTFSVVGGDERALAFIRELRLISAASSLGGVESLVSLPFNTSHRTQRAREMVGLPPGTVRLSVGCEYVDDLWTDLERALEVSR